MTSDGQAPCFDPVEVDQALTEVFGLAALRPGQGEVIADVLGGAEVVTVMPTGAGKSLCYQLPGVLLGRAGGVTLVVSPLIALMKDQVDGLRARGIPAAALTSAIPAAEQSEILANIAAASYRLVYVAPERFKSTRFVEAMAAAGDRLALFAVDEAHCISEWGHDFRPDYRRLGAVLGRLRPPRVIALTATATPEVREDIAAQLGMTRPRFHVRGFDRPNLDLSVVQAGGFADKRARVIRAVRERGDGVALVYAATRKNAERYTQALGEAGLRARVYHAGLADDDRHRAQDEFMAGAIDVVVATNAFGMGVDKEDIRVVVHADLPRSPEAYYQEVGRGGRDGGPARCLLLFNHGDVRLQEFLIAASFPTPELLRGLWRELRDRPELGDDEGELRRALAAPGGGRIADAAIDSAIRILTRHGYLVGAGDGLRAVTPDPNGEAPALDVDALARRGQVERAKLARMVDYAYHLRCRRQFVLDYFGDADWTDPERRCDGCDNCRGLAGARPVADHEAREVRDLLRVVARLEGRFGRGRVAAIANASDDDPRFYDLPERGVLRGHSDGELLDLLRAMEAAGLIARGRGDYPTLSITRSGLDAVDGERSIALVRPAPRTGKRRRGRARSGGAEPAVEVDPVAPGRRRGRRRRAVIGDAESLDPALVERLRELRSELAGAEGRPAYVVFSNRTLAAIAERRPNSAAELLEVAGIGERRLAAYGDAILAAVRGE